MFSCVNHKDMKNGGFLYDPMKPATPFISFHNIYMFVYFIKTSQIKSNHIIFILLDEIFPIISINKKNNMNVTINRN